jgi:hypothetical protein
MSKSKVAAKTTTVVAQPPAAKGKFDPKAYAKNGVSEA